MPGLVAMLWHEWLTVFAPSLAAHRPFTNPAPLSPPPSIQFAVPLSLRIVMNATRYSPPRACNSHKGVACMQLCTPIFAKKVLPSMVPIRDNPGRGSPLHPHPGAKF